MDGTAGSTTPRQPGKRRELYGRLARLSKRHRLTTGVTVNTHQAARSSNCSDAPLRDPNAFEYSSCPLGVGQIRVLEIQPGTKTDPIACKLVTINSANDEEYKALSYAWGDLTEQSPILVDDKPFMIHQNLFEALTHVRHEGEIIRLWADAVCIDQNNDQEKSTQVQEMGRTFSQAEEVLVWLGTPTSGLESALADVCEAANMPSSPSEAELAKYLPAIQDLFIRPWFQRLWVFQEVVLARRCLAMLGPSHCEFDSLLQITEHVMIFSDIMHQHDPEAFNDIYQGWAFLLALKGIDEARGKGQIKRWTQAKMMNAMRGQQCLDPRDHVYGMAGVCQYDGLPCEEVDYSKNVVEVFTTATRNVLLYARYGLSILIAWGVDREDIPCEHGLDRLPSWVPNWSTPVAARAFPHRLYEAGGPKSPPLTPQAFCNEGRSLVLEGIVISDIADRSKPVTDGSFDLRFLLDWEQRVTELCDAKSPYKSYGDRLAAFWRTLVADCRGTAELHSRSRWSCDDPGWAYNVLIGRARPRKETFEGVSRASDPDFKELYRQALSYALRGRSLILTKHGHLGLAPGASQVTDIITIFPGVSTPFVLRKRPAGGTYYMLGPAYVHGVMDGEAFRDYEDGKYQLQKFVID